MFGLHVQSMLLEGFCIGCTGFGEEDFEVQTPANEVWDVEFRVPSSCFNTAKDFGRGAT